MIIIINIFYKNEIQSNIETIHRLIGYKFAL